MPSSDLDADPGLPYHCCLLPKGDRSAPAPISRNAWINGTVQEAGAQRRRAATAIKEGDFPISARNKPNCRSHSWRGGRRRARARARGPMFPASTLAARRLFQAGPFQAVCGGLVLSMPDTLGLTADRCRGFSWAVIQAALLVLLPVRAFRRGRRPGIASRTQLVAQQRCSAQPRPLSLEMLSDRRRSPCCATRDTVLRGLIDADRGGRRELDLVEQIGCRPHRGIPGRHQAYAESPPAVFQRR